jgi:hypothetical protein
VKFILKDKYTLPSKIGNKDSDELKGMHRSNDPRQGEEGRCQWGEVGLPMDVVVQEEGRRSPPWPRTCTRGFLVEWGTWRAHYARPTTDDGR